jgi:short-subunit dehydrogenase
VKHFAERVAVVTGAAGGIGRATAVALASRGCILVLVDIDEGGLDATRGQVEEAGASTSIHRADVSNADEMRALAAAVRDRHGACHILVNNAGVTSAGRFADETSEDIEWIIGINVFGVVHGCQSFLPLLREADEAHIVNLSSMVAFVGLPQNATYSLTKGAVRSFTEGLRGELAGTSIGVTAVFPGAVRTNIIHAARGAEARRLSALDDTRFAPYLRHLMQSPEGVAEKIVSAIEHDKPRVLVGPDARLLDLAARILPGRTRLIGKALDRATRGS